MIVLRSVTINRISGDRLVHVEVVPLSPPVITLQTNGRVTKMVGTARASRSTVIASVGQNAPYKPHSNSTDGDETNNGLVLLLTGAHNRKVHPLCTERSDRDVSNSDRLLLVHLCTIFSGPQHELKYYDQTSPMIQHQTC